MKLGNFSISLNVKNISESVKFYQSIGFTEFGGDVSQNWLILKNGSTTIGLFQGMFEDNILTFNPGWDADCNTLDSYTDVREISSQLKQTDVTIVKEVEDTESGPASMIIKDPDGNTIMFDQHV